MTVGIDEVGRGSWAGPLCVAAVAWPDNARVRGLADSKLVSLARRPALAYEIRLKAASIGIGWVPADVIDAIGLTKALRLAAEQALAQINVLFDDIIVDGNLQLVTDKRARTQIKADATVRAVMAASLIAKVARDTYMCSIASQYAQHNFAKHVGYGTKQHRLSLAQFGPCTIHRFSYTPLKQFIV